MTVFKTILMTVFMTVFISLKLSKPYCDNVLLEHGGLPYVLPLADQLDFN